ncbi:MAG: bifunctional glutamate N-acetyltransferase/amino-acid acetyltransferase ArgJ [Proteobacteria bacterium]|nr:bifunctional glutamate N-acetyltransferase/amino-acid acetyltransferase ArgJ [Pseudomonadota bacterium]
MPPPIKQSPFTPKTKPRLTAIKGVRLAVGATAIKYKNRDDVALLAFSPTTAIAGVVTTSRTASAPIDWCRPIIKNGTARAILVNAGNANAFTGAAGIEAVEACANAVARALECDPSQVLLASTGVIGEVLPHAEITRHIADLAKRLETSESAWHKAAEAIRTTDTFAKAASRTTRIGDTPIHITAIAKGSGMIAPNMATMLAFITTDATLPSPILNTLLPPLVDTSFNAISVDSDTSTSDTLILAATAEAQHVKITSANDPRLSEFTATLGQLMIDLACQIVRDGEGASKFITIDIIGARSNAAAKRIGLAIANSPLVKTAMAGSDANWGRIIMAIGKGGEEVAREKIDIAIGGVAVTKHGMQHPDYDEAKIARHMAGDEINLAVNLNLGDGTARVWTCDFTHAYIDLNADYRS